MGFRGDSRKFSFPSINPLDSVHGAIYPAGGLWWVFMGEYGENEAGQQESHAVSDDATTSSNPMEPFFFGSYERALDDKGRFAVPFRFRRQDLAKEEEPPRFVIFEDPDGIVSLLTFDQYVRSMQQIMAMDADEERDEFLRWMADHSQEVPMDSQGRVAIPAAYLERIGISKRVKVRGMVNRMELVRPTEAAEAEQAGAAPPRKYFKRFFE
ncbi:hypothetical protein GF314_00520 [bacterium]|nr:hypothetical protein [bacterium]